MKDDMSFVIKVWILIIVGIVLLAKLSVVLDIPVRIKLPWDPGIF